MRRRAAGVLAVAVALSGCGGGESSEDILAETAANLDRIKSGTIHLDFRVEPRGAPGAESFGFTLDGPFSLGGVGALPLAQIDYSQTVGDETAKVTLISTGRKAYVRTEGRTYELPDEQADELRAAAGELRGGGGLGEFAIDEWIEDPELHDGGEVGGADTDHVQAELNVVNAVRDLTAFVRQLGRDVPQLGGQDVDQLADSVRSTRFEVYTGKEDRLLRRLEIEVDLAVGVPSELRRVLGSLVGARVLFELGVDDPNSAVTVPEPKDALPASALPGS